MSEYSSRKNYDNMMSQLDIFSKDVTALAANMSVSLKLCKNALNDNDKSIASICEKLYTAQQAYLKVACQARKISSQMKEELEMIEKEDSIWD